MSFCRKVESCECDFLSFVYSSIGIIVCSREIDWLRFELKLRMSFFKDNMGS